MQEKRFLVALVLCFFWATAPVSAQDKLSFGQLTRQVLTDPTTWAPVALFWTAAEGDWNSSYNLFRSGKYIEKNPRFTLSGKSPDTPIGFWVGARKNAAFTAQELGWSVVSNAGIRVSERFLNKLYPRHQRFVTILGWTARITCAVILVKVDAGPHIVQWRRNNRLLEYQPK